MTRAPLTHITVITAFILNTLAIVPVARAQEFYLPKPGVMVHLSPSFNPPILKGIKVHADNPFRFDFILDTGDVRAGHAQPLRDESIKLIKYFLASLTIPEKDLWVNLSPYEKDRIVPESFGLTEMGRDLLAEDYILKQITASLIYPEDELGKKFWKRIYEEAAKKYGTTNIPVNTFNKVWIIPAKAVVYERQPKSRGARDVNMAAKREEGNDDNTAVAYVVESKLKVMLEQDYLALQKNTVTLSAAKGLNVPLDSSASRPQNDINTLGSQIVREIVIPELTKEVNENKNFAQLRQVYNSLILATWYKKKIKDSILSQVYTDRNKVAGVNIDDPQEKEKIYQQYLKAFKKGVYNYIKEDLDPVTQEVIPRKYFSGGCNLSQAMLVFTAKIPDMAMKTNALDIVEVNLVIPSMGQHHDLAMPVVYPKNTWSKRNIDVIRFLTSEYFQSKTGINLKQGRHGLLNVGTGAWPFDTIELNNELKKMGNNQLELTTTEIPGSGVEAYIHLNGYFNSHRREIIAGLLSTTLLTSVDPQKLNDVVLAVNRDFQITEAIVGYERLGKQNYVTIAVSPDREYIGNRGDILGDDFKNPQLFREMIEYLESHGVSSQADRLRQTITNGELNKNGIILQPKPIEYELAKSDPKIRFVLTDDPARDGIVNQRVIMANNVTTHFSVKNEQEFIDTMKSSLGEQGILVINNIDMSKNARVITVYRRSEGRISKIGGITISNDRLAFIGEGVFQDISYDRERLFDFWLDGLNRVLSSIQRGDKRTEKVKTNSEEINTALDRIFRSLAPDADVVHDANAYMNETFGFELRDIDTLASYTRFISTHGGALAPSSAMITQRPADRAMKAGESKDQAMVEPYTLESPFRLNRHYPEAKVALVPQELKLLIFSMDGEKPVEVYFERDKEGIRFWRTEDEVFTAAQDKDTDLEMFHIPIHIHSTPAGFVLQDMRDKGSLIDLTIGKFFRLEDGQNLDLDLETVNFANNVFHFTKYPDGSIYFRQGNKQERPFRNRLGYQSYVSDMSVPYNFGITSVKGGFTVMNYSRSNIFINQEGAVNHSTSEEKTMESNIVQLAVAVHNGIWEKFNNMSRDPWDTQGTMVVTDYDSTQGAIRTIMPRNAVKDLNDKIVIDLAHEGTLRITYPRDIPWQIRKAVQMYNQRTLEQNKLKDKQEGQLASGETAIFGKEEFSGKSLVVSLLNSTQGNYTLKLNASSLIPGQIKIVEITVNGKPVELTEAFAIRERQTMEAGWSPFFSGNERFVLRIGDQSYVYEEQDKKAYLGRTGAEFIPAHTIRNLAEGIEVHYSAPQRDAKTMVKLVDQAMTADQLKKMFDGFIIQGADNFKYEVKELVNLGDFLKFTIGGLNGEIDFELEEGFFVSIAWVYVPFEGQGVFSKILERIFEEMPAKARIHGKTLIDERALRQMVKEIIREGKERPLGEFDKLMRERSGLKEVITTDKMQADLQLDPEVIGNDVSGNMRKFIYQYWKVMGQEKVDALFEQTRLAGIFIRTGFRDIHLEFILFEDQSDATIHFSAEKPNNAMLISRTMTGEQRKDKRMQVDETGGINLTPANMNLQTQNNGGEIKFHMDPAMLQQLQNAPGFVPVIINIQPMTDLRMFLGIRENEDTKQASVI